METRKCCSNWQDISPVAWQGRANDGGALMMLSQPEPFSHVWIFVQNVTLFATFIFLPSTVSHSDRLAGSLTGLCRCTRRHPPLLVGGYTKALLSQRKEFGVRCRFLATSPGTIIMPSGAVLLSFSCYLLAIITTIQLLRVLLSFHPPYPDSIRQRVEALAGLSRPNS